MSGAELDAGFARRDPDWSNVFDGSNCPFVVTGAVPAQVAERVPRGRLVYLATPYSREVLRRDGAWDLGLSMVAADRAAHHARRLMMHGVTAVSPIVLAAGMVHACRGTERAVDPLADDLWRRWCRPLLDACAAVVVPDIAGWQRSFGVHHEVAVALRAGLRVYFYAEGASMGVAA